MRCARLLFRWSPASIPHLPDLPSGPILESSPTEERRRQSVPLSLRAREELSKKSTQLKFHVVTSDWCGQRVDSFLLHHHPEWCYDVLKKLVQNGHIYRYMRKGRKKYTRLTDRLEFDELIVVPTSDHWKNSLAGPSELMGGDDSKKEGRTSNLSYYTRELARKMVLYKNEHVLVINKPSGLPMMPTNDPLEMNIASMLPAWRFSNKNNPFVCHNLDRETSGCVVLARTSGAHRQLGRMFVKRVVPNSVYWGFCVGKPSVNFGRLRMHFEVQQDGNRKQTIIARPNATKKSKVGIAEFVVNASALEYGSFISFYPLTTRRHQERIMAAHALRCPIVGDSRYGGDASFPSCFLFHDAKDNSIPLHLHHRKVQLPYKDSTGAFVCVTAPLPEYMHKTFKRLGWPSDADDPLIPG